MPQYHAILYMISRKMDNYKSLHSVIPAAILSGNLVLTALKTISPIEAFGDDKQFCKRLYNFDIPLDIRAHFDELLFKERIPNTTQTLNTMSFIAKQRIPLCI